MPFVILLSPIAAAPILAQEVTGSPAVTAQYRDPETIERITTRLAGQGRESWETVIADGEPPLTWGTVATFSLLLHECFDAQLTEAEARARGQTAGGELREQRRKPEIEKDLPLIQLSQIRQKLRRDLITPRNDARKPRQQFVVRQ